MGRRPEQTLLQRASADGCQAHEKPPKVAGQQREAKQDRSEVSPTPVGTALTRQSESGKCGRGWERREASPAGGLANWRGRYGKQ